MAADWLRSEIAEGFQRLLALRLDGHPPADVLPGTVQVWCDALRGRAWTHEDAVRVEGAFRTLAETSTRWPTPADFLRVLPPRPEPTALPAPRYPAEKARENIKRLRAMLGSVAAPMPRVRPLTDPVGDDACTCMSQGTCPVCRGWA